MATVFISHAIRDRERVIELARWLQDEGFASIFLDFDSDHGIQVGEPWEQRLYREISRCTVMLLALSPAWFESKWCFAEYTQARALGKTIFPVTIAPLDRARVAAEIQGLELIDGDPAGRRQLLRRLREVAAEFAFGLDWDRSRAPYPGIHAFEAADAPVFFGRDQALREVLERIEARRVQGGLRALFIVGGSGSGKSSLLKAGVLPQLARPNGRWLVMPCLRPGRDPVTALAKALAELAGSPLDWGQWRDRIDGGDAFGHLCRLMDTLRTGPLRDATLVLPIDQFEEVLTIAEPGRAATFLTLLNRLFARRIPLPILALVTLRSDLLDPLMQCRQFRLPFEGWPLRPMTMDRVARVIEGPAAVAGLALETGFTQRVARDFLDPQALPLLAFVLRDTYDRRTQPQALGIADYEAAGDPATGRSPLQNAVRRKAEAAMAAVAPTPGQVLALKTAFIGGLVRATTDGRFVRQRADRTTLPAAAWPLLETLVQARLLRLDCEPAADRPDAATPRTYLEVAHEVLFEAWPLLARWLAEERDMLVGMARLDQALSDWQGAAGRWKPQALLHGLQLARAERWLRTRPRAFSPTLTAFIHASSARGRRQRLALAALLASTLIVLAGVGVWRLRAYVARVNALECDLLAVEPDNNLGLPGVEFDKIDAPRAIPACEHAVADDPGNPRLLHNVARALERAGRYDAAAGWYRKAADLGFDWSRNNLGVLYLSAKGVPFDLREGVALLRAAAAQGNAQALANYAGTDYTKAFAADPSWIRPLEEALIARGLAGDAIADGVLSADDWAAIARFKAQAGLRDEGLSLRLLDQLGLIERLAAIRNRQSPEPATE